MRSGSVAVLLLWALAANGQSILGSSTSTSHPDQLFTSDLISWTAMQSPDPVDNSGQKNPEQNSAAQTNSPAGNQRSDTPTQTFTGMITREGNGYVLKISDKWFYDLDDQSEAAQYLDQHVAVTGTLNVSGDLIHVRLIQPVS